jgi:hypothetical protein
MEGVAAASKHVIPREETSPPHLRRRSHIALDGCCATCPTHACDPGRLRASGSGPGAATCFFFDTKTAKGNLQLHKSQLILRRK